MTKINDFRDLEIWQESIEVATQIYNLSKKNNMITRDYGLKDQITRSALSISSNIAEGFERNNDKEFARFLTFAKGSCGELRSQVILMNKIQILDSDIFESLYKDLTKLSKRINAFIGYLKK